MPNARPNLRQLAAGQSAILLLLDFDGTLSEIAPRPEDAALRPDNAPLLTGLARCPGCTVGVLSGRSLDDVSHRVGVSGLVYAGNHGLEIEGAGRRYQHPAAVAAIPAISQAADRLRSSLDGIPGALVENKTLSLTVHYRQTPEEHRDRVAQLFRDTVQPLVAASLCRVTTAKSALELRPLADWHKGRALELIRRRLAPQSFPIYIGDDVTDEDGYAAAQAAGGSGIFVGPPDRATGAHWRLDSPAAVTRTLADLLEWLKAPA